MAGSQLMKRIPRIKFPQRHNKISASSSQTQASGSGDVFKAFVSQSSSSQTSLSASGKASEQPKRASVSNEEIEAVLLGGCI